MTNGNEDKLRAIVFALEHTTLSDVAKETAVITSAETLTGVSIGHRPRIEQTTYSAKELGDVLGISANRVGRIANAHGLKTEEYGLSDLAVKPPTSGGGYKAIINYCNLTFLMIKYKI